MRAVRRRSTSAARTTGTIPGKRQIHVVPRKTLNRVAYETRFATLPARRECARALPDAATLFIRVGGRTVRVHGACEPRFSRLWKTLAKSIRPD